MGPKRGPHKKGTALYQKRSLHAVGKGPNKRTPLSYLDSYFGDAGKDVDFEVQNIVEQAKRNGSVIFKVVWKQLGAGFDNVEATWEGLENLKHMQPRIMENFLAKHDFEQEQAAKQADIARGKRMATAQAEAHAERTRVSLTGVGGSPPLLMLGCQRLSRTRTTATVTSSSAGDADETASGDQSDDEGNQATFPFGLALPFSNPPPCACFVSKNPPSVCVLCFKNPPST